MAKDLKIQNVVAYCTLGVSVSLEKIVANIPGTEYEPAQFPGLVYRMEEPKASFLIFSAGKIVCTGTNSPEMAKKAVDRVLKSLKSIGMKVPGNVDIEVVNIVASAKIGSDLPLNEIAFTLENVEYEPEQFPGLIYRMKSPKVAFLIFSSGRIVCTGGKRIEEVRSAVSKLEKELKEINALN